ncbi:antitoxin CptB [Azospirillaceae bacterium]
MTAVQIAQTEDFTGVPGVIPDVARRKRLVFRAWHRGTREADLLLGSFADRFVPYFSGDQLNTFEQLLELSDPDLYNWIVGREAVPQEHDNEVMLLLRQFKSPTIMH